MRLRLYTMERELGSAELLDGVTQKDVVTAMRNGQLYLGELKPADSEKSAPKAPKPTSPKAS